MTAKLFAGQTSPQGFASVHAFSQQAISFLVIMEPAIAIGWMFLLKR
jgi:hypothetical protein